MFESCWRNFATELLVIPFTPICQSLSEETLKAAGPFYLMSMPGEVNDTTHGGKCKLSWTSTLLENDNSEPTLIIRAAYLGPDGVGSSVYHAVVEGERV